jgi:hypothetical protein
MIFGMRAHEPRAFDAALRKAGQSKLGNALSNKKGRDKVLARVRKAVNAVKTDAAILGVVQRWAGKPRVYLVWVNADNEDLPFDEPIAIKGGDDARNRAIALEPAMKMLAPSTSDDTKTAAANVKGESADDKPEAKDRVRHEAGSSILAIELGFELGGRQFTSSDGISPDTSRNYGV